MMPSQSAAFTVSGQVVDIWTRDIYPANVHVADGRIQAIERLAEAPMQYILPGFVDAHVHVESSMLVPTEFARLAVLHGTVATVSDPHEIGNVLGIEGVRFMIENGRKVPFKFYFGAPSCVPATTFETAGAVIDVEGVKELLAMPEVVYLAEMMNFPGVLHADAEVMAKIAAAHAVGKPVDGHAPGLRGEQAKRYFAAGITTDHECFTHPEAFEKAELGVKILIREGSAAKNFEALHPILASHPELAMLCSDDKHPDSLLLGHINELVARAMMHGHDLYDLLFSACAAPVLHYKLDVGLLRVDDPADFIIVRDLIEFKPRATFINGSVCMWEGKSLLPHLASAHPNHFKATAVLPEDLRVVDAGGVVRVIVVEDGQLVTKSSIGKLPVLDGCLQSDTEEDILKIVVLNRYANTPPAVAFVQNFGLKRGAIAGSVAHDSHNIIATGTNDADIAQAINLVIQSGGGLSLADGEMQELLPLPIAGLMTDADGYEVAEAYTRLDAQAKALGATLGSPYMTLSFCALLVIPALKLSDKGLFDGDSFQFTPLQFPG